MESYRSNKERSYWKGPNKGMKIPVPSDSPFITGITHVALYNHELNFLVDINSDLN